MTESVKSLSLFNFSVIFKEILLLFLFSFLFFLISSRRPLIRSLFLGGAILLFILIIKIRRKEAWFLFLVFMLYIGGIMPLLLYLSSISSRNQSSFLFKESFVLLPFLGLLFLIAPPHRFCSRKERLWRLVSIRMGPSYLILFLLLFILVAIFYVSYFFSSFKEVVREI